MPPIELQPYYQPTSSDNQSAQAVTRENATEQAPEFRPVSVETRRQSVSSSQIHLYRILIGIDRTCAFLATFQTIGPNLSKGVF